MIWFIADLHFGHSAVIRYARRPFRDAEHMDSELVARWNHRVSPEDTVYLLGDVSFRQPGHTRQLLDGLNGKIHLVRGNHDRQLKGGMLDRFESVENLVTIKVPDPDAPARMGRVQRIVLCHYAMRVWDKMHYGAWHLHGHSHGSLPDLPHSLSLDMGVDVECWHYAPASYEQVKERMSYKSFKPVDHHER